MNAKDFIAWMDATGNTNAADIVRTLGIGRNHAQEMVAAARAGQDISVKPTVALAMTAVANGLRPWDQYER